MPAILLYSILTFWTVVGLVYMLAAAMAPKDDDR